MVQEEPAQEGKGVCAGDVEVADGRGDEGVFQPRRDHVILGFQA